MVRKKKALLLAEQEAAKRRRQASPQQPSLFRRLVASVSSASQAADVSIQDLNSEVRLCGRHSCRTPLMPFQVLDLLTRQGDT